MERKERFQEMLGKIKDIIFEYEDPNGLTPIIACYFTDPEDESLTWEWDGEGFESRKDIEIKSKE